MKTETLVTIPNSVRVVLSTIIDTSKCLTRIKEILDKYDIDYLDETLMFMIFRYFFITPVDFYGIQEDLSNTAVSLVEELVQILSVEAGIVDEKELREISLDVDEVVMDFLQGIFNQLEELGIITEDRDKTEYRFIFSKVLPPNSVLLQVIEPIDKDWDDIEYAEFLI